MKCVHDEINLYICGQCDYKASDLQSLREHKRTHHPLLHRCDVCNYTTTKKCNLERHLRTHTGEKPFACTQCDFTTATQSHLTEHVLRKHTDARPFPCTQCDSKFVTNHKLQTHILRKHTNFRPHRCDHCKKTWVTQGDLQRHVRAVHLGEQPYKCGECGRVFSRADSLRTHEALHESSEAWTIVCPYADCATDAAEQGVPCGKRFPLPWKLEYHIKFFHTLGGLRTHLQTEQKMANLFQAHGIPYLRDWQNAVYHSHCPQLALPGSHSRPDFLLPEFTAAVNAYVLVGNDEFAHRQYPSHCELKRVLNITSAVSAYHEQQSVRLAYIRFNPHHYMKGDILYDPSLESRHAKLLQLLEELQSGSYELQDQGLTLIYLYYDRTADGELSFFKDLDSVLAPAMAACARIYEE